MEIPISKQLAEQLAPYAGIAASISGIYLFRQTVSQVVKGCWRPFRFFLDLASSIEHLSTMVADVQHQVKTNNGSSLKDAVVRVETQMHNVVESFSVLDQYRQNAFWREPRPCIELDRSGQAILVSEATCRLFAIVNPDDALRYSWLQFLEGRHVEELKRCYKETAVTGSLFRFTIQIFDEDRRDRGHWEFKATPIGPELYSGFFSPVDEIAKEIANRCGWLR